MKRNKTIHNKQYSDLVEKLYLERKCLGLSQAEVGNCLNMTQSEISKIESGERRLDILEFKKLLLTYHMNENMKLKKFVMDFFEMDK